MPKLTVVRADHQAEAPAAAKLAPRGPLPAGSTLTIIDNGKPKARTLMRFIAEELAAELPITAIEVVSKPAASRPLEPEQAREVAAGSQVVLAGLGDCGACSACSLHDVIQLEALGVPGTLIFSEPFQGLVAEFGLSLGVTSPPAVAVPHPISSRDDEYLRSVARAAAADVRERLVGKGAPVSAAV
jgi:hypothetical protein